MQNEHNAPIQSQVGSAFVMSLVFATLFSIIGIGTMKLVSRGDELRARDEALIKSYWTNYGAIRLASRYLSMLGSVTEPCVDDVSLPFLKGGTPDTLNGQPIPNVFLTNENCATKTYHMRCSTDIDSKRYQLSVMDGVALNRLSKYTYFFGTDVPALKWQHQQIDGNCHLNGLLRPHHLMGPAIKVTGAITTSMTTANPHMDAPYDKGIELMTAHLSDYGSSNATRTDWIKQRFPNYSNIGAPIDTDVLDPNDITNAYFIPRIGDRAVKLVMKGKKICYFRGTYYETVNPGDWRGAWWMAHDAGNRWNMTDTLHVDTLKKYYNSTIVADDAVYLSGKLDGQLTVATKKRAYNDIWIHNYITYADSNLDPDHDSMSTDVLGVISGDDIWTAWGEVDTIYMGGGIPQWANKFRYNGVVAAGFYFAPFGCVRVRCPQYYEGIQQFHIYGGLSVKAQVAGTHNGNDGLALVIHKDPRVLADKITVPGIPLAKTADSETGGTMWVLGSGSWKNYMRKKSS